MILGHLSHRLTLTRYLVLVAEIKHDKAKDKKGLIDYNAHVFQDALTEVLARKWENEPAKTGEENNSNQEGEQA